MIALNIKNIPINDYCVGLHWVVGDQEQLAKLIAIIVMGQATYAAHIINELIPAHPMFSNEALKNEAIIKFTIQEKQIPKKPRKGYPRIQRDGLIFEIISWIAAKQVAGGRCLLKDPHINATTQGLDGFMIELSEDGNNILRSTIFEDKCTESPRKTFTQSVLPGFLDRHCNTRNAEIIAIAASLIKLSGKGDVSAMVMAEKVLDNNFRYYRAGFALTNDFDTDEARIELFKGYDKVDNITAEQRIGASLIVDIQLRDWFDNLANQIIGYIHELDGGRNNV